MLTDKSQAWSRDKLMAMTHSSCKACVGASKLYKRPGTYMYTYTTYTYQRNRRNGSPRTQSHQLNTTWGNGRTYLKVKANLSHSVMVCTVNSVQYTTTIHGIKGTAAGFFNTTFFCDPHSSSTQEVVGLQVKHKDLLCSSSEAHQVFPTHKSERYIIVVSLKQKSRMMQVSFRKH